MDANGNLDGTLAAGIVEVFRLTPSGGQRTVGLATGNILLRCLDPDCPGLAESDLRTLDTNQVLLCRPCGTTFRLDAEQVEQVRRAVGARRKLRLSKSLDSPRKIVHGGAKRGCKDEEISSPTTCPEAVLGWPAVTRRPMRPLLVGSRKELNALVISVETGFQPAAASGA